MSKHADLILEVNEGNVDQTFIAGRLMMTPIVSPDYWLFRVRLSETQAILGFPKFSTIGVGFEQEEDWNTNLPYNAWEIEGTNGGKATPIWEHIKHNKGDAGIADERCLAAIRMIIDAAEQYMTLKVMLR